MRVFKVKKWLIFLESGLKRIFLNESSCPIISYNQSITRLPFFTKKEDCIRKYFPKYIYFSHIYSVKLP